jgi:lipopolysaccharide transport system permease protein
MKTQQEIVYCDSPEKKAGFTTWASMFRDLWVSRELVQRLMLRDISVKYRQSLFGYIWALVVPIVTVTIFAFLVSRRVLPVNTPSIPYPVYALWGIVLWQFFAGALSAATQSLESAGSLVTKINFPKEVLVIASAGQPLFDLTIKLVLVLGVTKYYGVGFSISMFAIFVAVFSMLVLALGLGFFLSILNLVIRDTANIVNIVATLGIFAAPIFYLPPTSAPFFLVNVLNPFSPLLIAVQDLVAYGELRHMNIFLGVIIFSVMVFMFGWRTFRLAIRRVAERA